ncbi:NAD(P)H-dependent glycerol-3-phosphate dehydrogenase [Candidatus Neptunochlamydia vexilliferae]|uniref:Glycerol-3-phosphate dehydrogenase [NAD(P)+] n=1 Tax=Candidatus Neptunichlamydia vexilliferae TaxID=1651774 RepID=A0ABS0AX91_9BACT|nr:NAD(P)H-dependent glycerol-3-phosphate dehydrogenase [Candidatus Neptunochlamydia vexilliferae]MBF5058748.1 Glycerol-3-phosphate dehydrogenase [NAD(P)+] [Candidatus Neptunochlamydia vexilliferae]
MRIGYLGAGAWGFCLANLLAEKGYEVKLWTGNMTLAEALKRGESHPKLQDHQAEENLVLTTDIKEAVTDVDLIVESVTSKGLRPVLEQLKSQDLLGPPIVLTSKGIEQGTGLLMSEVALDVLGADYKERIGCLSGPSLAAEVMRKLPTSVVASAYNPSLMMTICETFTTSCFRVYPNEDMRGVSFGGAMKNIIAIACAISDGLGYGENTKAALMTRGLHEIRKLGDAIGCSADALNGLSGMGDLCATCLSTLSRNYIFGKLLAEGHTPDEAREKIGMVVEGAYTCASALELSAKTGVDMPITEAIHAIIYEGVKPQEAVDALLGRAVKQEHL